MPQSSAPPAPSAPREQVYAKDCAAWRRWLQKHHATSPAIWLVYDRKSIRADRLTHAEAVQEALCFGWIDGTSRSLDDKQYLQLFTRRKPKSTWSRVNKGYVTALLESGLMTEAGLAAINVAKANGSWTSLDLVESLTVPDDLAAALARMPAAARNFAAFAPSAKKGFLHWVSQAVRPETRATRVAEVVTSAAANQKARQLPAQPATKRATKSATKPAAKSAPTRKTR